MITFVLVTIYSMHFLNSWCILIAVCISVELPWAENLEDAKK